MFEYLSQVNIFLKNSSLVELNGLSFSVTCSMNPKEGSQFLKEKHQIKNTLAEFRHLLEVSYEPSRKSCLLGPERREDGAETNDGCNGW